jgi:hypothetical protein
LIRGWAMIRTSAIAMNAGTIAANADAGRLRSSTAPITPPISEATASRASRRRWPASSRR